MRFEPGHRITPLITGSETYAALEEAIASASESIHLAYWTVDATMPLISEAGSVDGDDWCALLTDAVRRGTEVKLILSDFDPIFANGEHRGTWYSYRRFNHCAAILDAGLDAELRSHFQIQCDLHEAKTGTLTTGIAQPVLRNKLQGILEQLSELAESEGREQALSRLAEMPGLWSMVREESGRFKIDPAWLAPLHPGSHHEKICIIDGHTVFLGGLDIDPKRLDRPDHDSENGWHDVACRIDGPLAQEVERHFRTRWNIGTESFAERLEGFTAPAGIEPLPETPLTPFEDIDPATIVDDTGSVPAAFIRTQSEDRQSPLAVGPKADVTEIAENYREVILGARQFIYVENQFLRSRDIVDWLVAAHEQNPALELIVLLPLVPERISETDDPNTASRQGQALQRDAVSRLRDCYEDKIGIFTLLRNGPPPEPVRDQARLHGSDMVYVHAKILIADDETAIIGSANLNGRSLYADSEAAVIWRDRDTVRHFRNRLWQQHLRSRTIDWDDDWVGRWTRAANLNCKRPPGDRQGFVVHLPDERAGLFAKDHPLVPERLV